MIRRRLRAWLRGEPGPRGRLVFLTVLALALLAGAASVPAGGW